MMTLYTPIPTEVIHNKNLNEQQFHTYCLIMEKCWKPEEFRIEWTEPLSMSTLAKDLGKPRTTLMRHIDQLVAEKLIEIHRYSEIAFALIPTATVHQPTELSTGGPITINTSSTREESLSALKKKNVHERTPVHERTVAVEIVEILKNAGVGDPMRWRIAKSGISLDDVRNWLNWMIAEGKPLNYAIAAMRDGLPAPESCKVCHGWNGEHKGVVDEDSNYLMCPREDRPELNALEIFEVYGEMSPTI